MANCRIIRHVLIPAGVLMAENASPTSKEHVCKRSELPLYGKDAPNACQPKPCPPPEPGVLENAVGGVRRGLFAVGNELKTVKNVGQDFVQSGVDQASGVITFLQKEENSTPKYGAVGVGGITGLILGLKGGFIKRTLYGSLGALAMAAICYPKEAAEYSEIGIEEGKRYATIGYNFIYGVKKGDPPLELPSLPKLPETMSEAWDLAKNLGKSSSSVTDPSLKESKVRKVKRQKQKSEVAVDSEIVSEEPSDSHEICACHKPDSEDLPAPTSLEFARIKNFLQSVTMNSFLPIPTDSEVNKSSPKE